MRVGPFFLVFAIPVLVVAGISMGAWWSGAAIAFVFGVVPVLDAWVGRDTKNGAPGTAHARFFDVPLVLWAIVQLGVQSWWIARVAAQAALGGLGAADFLAAASVGLMAGGIGITVAHELMHRPSRPERALAEVLMSAVTYTHFCIEHVHGHHRHVATPRDPASSRLGESVYQFLPRTIVGGLVGAWSIEAERMRRVGAPVISPRNRMLRYAAVQLVIYATLGVTLGAVAMLLWALQSIVGVVLLEVINYVEHYGLRRRELSPGKYERVLPRHSWNSSHQVTNWLLFNLQRHSDHHFLASRPYDVLRHYDEVPQLPAGYATMVLMALVPPLWHRVMDPRARAVNAEAPSTARAA
jgi:alkane 1-monooxygenase